MKPTTRVIVLCVTLVTIGSTAPGEAHPPLPASPAARPQLRSIYSGDFDVPQFVRGDTRALVFVFFGTDCPVAQQYVPRLNEFQERFRDRGIRFLGAYSDPGVEIHEMAVHAHDQDIAFPVFKDVDRRLAQWLEATITPEVVIVTSDLKKVYQGAIDDQFERRGRKSAATKHYLLDALEDVLAGRDVKLPFARASGCLIERREPVLKAVDGVAYHKDIAHIVARHCGSCHREGGPGPFELLTYDDVSMNSEKIREVIVDRRMPPWHGELNPKFGGIRNDKRLPDRERDLFVAWLDAGAPEGPRNATAPPPDATAGEPSDWKIGTIDYIYRMPKPFRVPKRGVLDYQFFRVPLGFDQDRWFEVVEIKPGRADVVHHITLHVVPESKSQIDGLLAMAQLYGVNGNLGHLINDYVPGDSYNAKVYPPGQGVRIPKHSDLIFEVHYTPNNASEVDDQSMVAFRWARSLPKEEVLTEVFRKPIGRFRVPPHHPHYRVEDTYHFEHDVLIDAVRPHFHLRGKSFRLEIIERDPDTDAIESATTLLSISAFDPSWQRTYELDTPLRLPAGRELRAVGHFDNSDINPNNPNPDIDVSWGQQTKDEMFSTRFKYRLDRTANGGVR